MAKTKIDYKNLSKVVNLKSKSVVDNTKVKKPILDKIKEQPIQLKEVKVVAKRLPNLKSDNTAIGKFGAKVLSAIGNNKSKNNIKNFREVGKKVITSAAKIADPTGVSNYGDLAKAFKGGNKGAMLIEGIASLPMVGKVGKAIKIAETALKGVKTGIKPIQTTRRVMQGISEAKDYLPKQKMKNTKMPYTTMPKIPIKPTPLKNK